ncbi:uncharacterized protein LOC126824168 [Patella vulgata]|uniref:uncharacterized protein LOC126824168 n=1 Tax=Patella vulgata TaxID=6465 RepID=UPI0021801DB3|nr:uncharacterized protein LOC126824168 [Patella vulgata]
MNRMTKQESKDFERISASITEALPMLTEVIDNRKALVRILRDEAEKLNKLEKGVQKSEITGSAVGVIGGVMILAGVLGAPFTFGGSLSLTSAGGALGAAGGITGAGAAIAKSIITRNKRKEINKLLETDERLMGKLNEKLKLVHASAKLVFSGTKLVARLAKSVVKTLRVGDVAADAAKVGAKGLSKFSKTIKNGGAVLTAIAIPFEIYNIVSNSVDIHKGKQNELAKEFKRIANEIEGTEKHLNEMKSNLSNSVQ